ncbi:MAG: hypothetical protein WC223_13225 [Bacteroidales bacterium]|jgi:hypothetical protein
MTTRQKYGLIIFIISFIMLVYYSEGLSQCPNGYHSTGIERVINGNFENGNASFTSSYGYRADSAGYKQELWTEGLYSVWTNSNDLHSNWSVCTDKTSGSGKFMIINGATTADVGIWQQNINVSINTIYYFTTWISSVHPTNPAQLQFSVNGVLLGSIFNASTTTCLWQQFYATWNSGSNTNANISIVNKNTTASGNDFGLDNVSFIPCAQDSSLPIELNYFKAALTDKGFVNLSWQTLSEINNDKFIVERSVDAINFHPFDSVKSEGNSIKATNYLITDTYPFSGISFYRLTQIDYDGKIKHVGLVKINNNLKNIKNLMVLQGNSFSELLFKFYSNSKEAYNITVVDIIGNIIKQEKIDISIGYNTYNFNSSNISDGVYLIILQSSSEQYISRFMVKNVSL